MRPGLAGRGPDPCAADTQHVTRAGLPLFWRYSKRWSINVATKSVRTYIMNLQSSWNLIKLTICCWNHWKMNKTEQGMQRNCASIRGFRLWEMTSTAVGQWVCGSQRQNHRVCLTSFGFPIVPFIWTVAKPQNSLTASMFCLGRESEIIILEIPWPMQNGWKHLQHSDNICWPPRFTKARCRVRNFTARNLASWEWVTFEEDQSNSRALAHRCCIMYDVRSLPMLFPYDFHRFSHVRIL